MELSALIRRVALARRPREEVAGLTGDRWLAWLETTLPGIGEQARTALLDAPYARRCRFDVPDALAACERWIPARMKLRVLALAVACATMLAHGASTAETLQARLDRNPIHDDETVRLIVEARTQVDGLRPDVAPLRRDFEILGQSTTTHVAVENGARSVRTEWIIELAPKRPGHFTIGPLTVGAITSPALELEVLPSSSSATRTARDVFLEMEVTPREVYVQAQLVCVLRIYRAAEFLEAKLSDFDPDGAITHKLGNDSAYSKTIDGRRYRIIERRFAVFAQSSGPLVLPAIRLDARIAEPGAASTMGRLFGDGRRVRIATQPVEVTVKPRPGADATPWLPATAVTFTEEWPQVPPRLVAGEPVTWTLRLRATGLAGVQLPPIGPPALEGARIYPDQPTIVTRTSTEAVHGERVQRVAVVPGAAGTLAIPEIRVQWWDVESDAPRTVLIPARTMSVAPSPASAAAPRPVLAAPPASPETSPRPWQIASAALAFAWLLTLGAFVRVLARSRRADSGFQAPADEPRREVAAARRRVLDACNAADPRAARPGPAGLGPAGLARGATPATSSRSRHALPTSGSARRSWASIAPSGRVRTRVRAGPGAPWPPWSLVTLRVRLRPDAVRRLGDCPHCTPPDAGTLASPIASSCSFFSIHADSTVAISVSSLARRMRQIAQARTLGLPIDPRARQHRFDRCPLVAQRPQALLQRFDLAPQGRRPRRRSSACIRLCARRACAVAGPTVRGSVRTGTTWRWNSQRP